MLSLRFPCAVTSLVMLNIPWIAKNLELNIISIISLIRSGEFFSFLDAGCDNRQAHSSATMQSPKVPEYMLPKTWQVFNVPIGD